MLASFLITSPHNAYSNFGLLSNKSVYVFFVDYFYLSNYFKAHGVMPRASFG
jgi:hypothetical protein